MVLESRVEVVTYNLYWWCVSDEYGTCPQFADQKGFQLLYERIKTNGPLDLIGFQECDDVGKIVAGAGLASSFRYFAPAKGLGRGSLSVSLRVYDVVQLYMYTYYLLLFMTSEL